jgi:cation transport ATPase
MAVIPLTLTVSLCLFFTFIVFFLREHTRDRISNSYCIRSRVKEDLAKLTSQGYTNYILSGDTEIKVTTLASQLGIPNEHALSHMTPQAKS